MVSYFELVKFAQVRYKLSVCDNRSAYFYFCGEDNLLGGQFWAMGRFILLGEQNNILRGQLLTQLNLLFNSLRYYDQDNYTLPIGLELTSFLTKTPNEHILATI